MGNKLDNARQWMKGENDEMLYEDARYETAFNKLKSELETIIDNSSVTAMKANLEKISSRDDSVETITYRKFIKNLMDTEHKFKQRIEAIEPNIFYKSGYAM